MHLRLVEGGVQGRFGRPRVVRREPQHPGGDHGDGGDLRTVATDFSSAHDAVGCDLLDEVAEARQLGLEESEASSPECQGPGDRQGRQAGQSVGSGSG